MQLITHALTKCISQAPEKTKQYSDGFTYIPLLSPKHICQDILGNSIKNLGTQSSSLSLFTYILGSVKCLKISC